MPPSDPPILTCENLTKSYPAAGGPLTVFSALDLAVQPGEPISRLPSKIISLQKKRWWLRPPEKNVKLNEMPCHHQIEDYLDACIGAAGTAGDRNAPLFRSAISKTAQLTDRPMLRGHVWRMARHRASGSGTETATGCHTFRGTGISNYLANGGFIEVAQCMSGQSNGKTTGSTNRATTTPASREVERIGI